MDVHPGEKDAVCWRRSRRRVPRFGRTLTPRRHIWAGFSSGLVAPFGQERGPFARDPVPSRIERAGDGCASFFILARVLRNFTRFNVASAETRPLIWRSGTRFLPPDLRNERTVHERTFCAVSGLPQINSRRGRTKQVVKFVVNSKY